jgi:hypothetical protein
MSPVDALLAKQAAFEGMRTEGWSHFARGYIMGVTGRLPPAVSTGRPAPAVSPVHSTAEGLTADLVRCLDSAEVFYVSPEMNRLVTAAAESWPADEVLRRDDVPSPDGWLWIPEMLPITGVHQQGSGGITTVDIRGQLLSTSAISWHVFGGRMQVVYWADKNHDTPHVKAAPGWRVMPRLTPWHELEQPVGQPLVQSLQLGTVLPPEVSQAINWSVVAGEDGSQALVADIPHEGWSPEQVTPTVGVDKVMAWLVTALRLMREPISSVRCQGLPANVRRSMHRRPVTVKNKSVTVIEFRHSKGDREHLRGFEFSHRFLRRGHWRKQWYGSGEGRHQESIWIHPTIVGDSGKPLIFRSHVNALVR